MKEQKALIITFHCCPNYGAVLQTYGLYSYLCTIFKNVEVLDYEPVSLMNEYKDINTFSLASVVTSIWSLPSFKRKKRKFSEFIKKMRLTNKAISVSQIKETDATFCFVGSDQIWNPDITNGFDDLYFGKIPHNKVSFTVISYGASLGKNVFSSEELMILKRQLLNVSYISVREEAARNILESEIGIKSEVVLDPTLLAGIEAYKNFVRKINKDPYLLIYTLNNNPEESIRPLARKIANEKGVKIIEIYGGRKGFRYTNHKVIYDASPEDFLSYLANAKYVVTDSFHGTAFSLMFHKLFVTIPHRTRGSRMVSLLSVAHLTNRLVTVKSVFDIDTKINWKEVDYCLSLARKYSEMFIMNSIKQKKIVSDI